MLRSRGGLVQKIVEQKDASPAQLKVRECNIGVLAAPAALLGGWLARLKANNAQREYYLTDVIAMAVARGLPSRRCWLTATDEVLGVNDKVQLAEVERLLRARAARALLQAGVTLADPARVDVRGTLEHGSDVFVDVNVVFEGTVRLGDRVRIGAGLRAARLRGRRGHAGASAVHHRGCAGRQWLQHRALCATASRGAARRRKCTSAISSR